MHMNESKHIFRICIGYFNVLIITYNIKQCIYNWTNMHTPQKDYPPLLIYLLDFVQEWNDVSLSGIGEFIKALVLDSWRSRTNCEIAVSTKTQTYIQSVYVIL